MDKMFEVPANYTKDVFQANLCPFRCFTPEQVELCQNCIDNSYILSEMILLLIIVFIMGIVLGYWIKKTLNYKLIF